MHTIPEFHLLIYILCVFVHNNGGQKRTSDSPELKSQSVVSHLTLVLSTQLGYSGRTASG